MATISTLGKRILLARRDRQLTQSALAKAGGISPNTIARIERGVLQDLQATTVARLAAYLDLPMEYLVGFMSEEDLTIWRETRVEREKEAVMPNGRATKKARVKTVRAESIARAKQAD